jgi:phosphoserine aminotransferase
MISFYPGPSRIYDDIPKYVKEAHREGILGIHHRSETFVDLSKKTIALLKEKLNIPSTYSIFFVSSATECWEILAQSLHSNRSYHIYNGAFGEKWYDYNHRLNNNVTALPFEAEQELQASDHEFKEAHTLICLTQNETSNGTQISNKLIKQTRKKNPFHLIAVDATSSMAGITLDFKSADIWFASVQKCFGLPAGMGIMICSKNAIARAITIAEKNHYNSLTFLIEKMEDWQTPYTPNVLSIYLLMRVLENMPTMKDIHQQTLERYQNWVDFFSNGNKFELFVSNPAVRSNTVLTIKAAEKNIKQIKKLAANAGFFLGDGYGKLKSSTFRIANFPAIKDGEIKQLKKILTDIL